MRFRTSGADIGGSGDGHPSSGPKFLHFHVVFGKNRSNSRLLPTGDWRLSPLGNPGSATGHNEVSFEIEGKRSLRLLIILMFKYELKIHLIVFEPHLSIQFLVTLICSITIWVFDICQITHNSAVVKSPKTETKKKITWLSNCHWIDTPLSVYYSIMGDRHSRVHESDRIYSGLRCTGFIDLCSQIDIRHFLK